MIWENNIEYRLLTTNSWHAWILRPVHSIKPVPALGRSVWELLSSRWIQIPCISSAAWKYATAVKRGQFLILHLEASAHAAPVNDVQGSTRGRRDSSICIRATRQRHTRSRDQGQPSRPGQTLTPLRLSKGTRFSLLLFVEHLNRLVKGIVNITTSRRT